MFYLLMVPATVFLLLEIWHVAKVQKHDRVLFRICRTRSRLVWLLADEAGAGKLTRDQYLYGRMMLASLNNVVRLYAHDRHKRRFFNFYNYLRFVHAYVRSSKKFVQVPRADHEQLQLLEREIGSAIFEGFLAYTPFLRHQITLSLLTAVLRLLGRVGTTTAKRWVQARLDDLRWLRTQGLMFGHPELAAA